MSIGINSDLILSREDYNRVAEAAKEVVRLYADSLVKDDALEMYAIMREFSNFFSMMGAPRYNERFLPKAGAPALRNDFEKINLIKDDLDELLSKIDTINEASLEIGNLSEARRGDISLLTNQLRNDIANFELELSSENVIIFSDDFSDDSKVASKTQVNVDSHRQVALLNTISSESMRPFITKTIWSLPEVPLDLPHNTASYGKKFGIEGLDVHYDDSVRHYPTPPIRFLYDDIQAVERTLDSEPKKFFDSALEYELVVMEDRAKQDRFIRDQISFDLSDEISLNYGQKAHFLTTEPELRVSLITEIESPVIINTVRVKTRFINREVTSSAIESIHVIDNQGGTTVIVPVSPTQRIFNVPTSNPVQRVTVFFVQPSSYKIAHDVRVFTAQQTDRGGRVKTLYQIRDIDISDVGLGEDEFGGRRRAD